jgi:protein-disulfide isomerase
MGPLSDQTVQPATRPGRRHSPSRRCAALAIAGVLAAIALSGCVLNGSPRVPPVDSASIENRVATYFRRTTNLPRTASIRLATLEPSAVPGWQDGRIEVSVGGETRGIDFIATNDGRYLLQGEMVDLSIDPVQTTVSRLTVEGRPVLGDPVSPVTVVVFADFQCPFCAKASRTIHRKLVSNYPGRAKLVFKNLPLHQIHSWADNAAIAGECAHRESNKAFWALHDTFYEMQTQLSNRNLREVATRVVQRAGGDPKRFGECMRTRATEDVVNADVAEAALLGVKSTPTFFINGRRITGAQPIEGFTLILDEELESP